MLTLFHAPLSRSTRIVQLIREMGLQEDITVHVTDIARVNGSGQADSGNPHPDGKVPALQHDDAVLTESNAIMLYLTDMFPDSGMGRPVGDPERGAYLTWLAWYGNVLEPVLILHMSGISDPALERSFRGMDAALQRLKTALSEGDYLMGARFSAVDILVSSAFSWGPDSRPDDPVIGAWLDRCMARPAMQAVTQEDLRAMGMA